MGTFLRSQMLFDDGVYYKWKAKDDNDDPKYLRGQEHSELNRTEGYEVLPFINNMGDEYWTQIPANLATYQKIERMIRNDVPSNIRTRVEIAKWIVANWNS